MEFYDTEARGTWHRSKWLPPDPQPGHCWLSMKTWSQWPPSCSDHAIPGIKANGSFLYARNRPNYEFSFPVRPPRHLGGRHIAHLRRHRAIWRLQRDGKISDPLMWSISWQFNFHYCHFWNRIPFFSVLNIKKKKISTIFSENRNCFPSRVKSRVYVRSVFFFVLPLRMSSNLKECLCADDEDNFSFFFLCASNKKGNKKKNVNAPRRRR